MERQSLGLGYHISEAAAMTLTDYKALCAELLKGLDENRHPEVRYPGHLRIIMARARAALAQPEPQGAASSLLNIPTKAMPTKERDLIQRLTELAAFELSKRGLGCELLAEARNYLAQPEPEGLSDKQLTDMACAVDLLADMGGEQFASPYREDSDIKAEVLAFARVAIAADRARYARPTIEPVPEVVGATMPAAISDMPEQQQRWYVLGWQAARAALAQPEPEVPSDEEIDALERQFWQSTGVVNESLQQEELFNYRAFLRAGLARWGRTAIEPVPEGYSEGPLSEFSDGGVPLG
jgi:hypothetical protein